MSRHSFTYEQYCNIIGKNVVIEELSFLNGKKKIRCLHSYKCTQRGGCTNPYVLRKIQNALEKNNAD